MAIAVIRACIIICVFLDLEVGAQELGFCAEGKPTETNFASQGLGIRV